MDAATRLVSLRLALGLCLAAAAVLAPRAGAGPSASDSQDRCDRALAVLRQALQDDAAPDARVRAAEALVYHGYGDEVRGALGAGDRGIGAGSPAEIAALRVSVQLERPGAGLRGQGAGALREAFLKGEGAARDAALEALAKLGWSEPIPELLQEAEAGPGLRQVYARWTLANSGDPGREATLCQGLGSDDPAVRRLTAEALGRLPKLQAATLAKLETAAGDEALDFPTRSSAATALLLHGPPGKKEEIAETLRQWVLLRGKEAEEAACAALAHCGAPGDLPFLDAFMDRGGPVVRVSAAHAALRIERRRMRGIGWIDWLVVVLYGLAVLGLGFYCSRKQTSTEEYFVASRGMSPFVIGISLFATLLSTISYLAVPGEMVKHGPMILCGLVSIPIAYVIVGYAVIPRLMRLRITSAYEILEERLGVSIRLFGALIFIAIRFVWMGVLVYMAAKATAVMLGLGEQSVPWIILITGLVAVAYTTLGGLRAVVITDVFQFFLLAGGVVLTIVLISVRMGGVGAWWPTSWAPNWDVQPFFSFDPHVRVTVVGAVLAQLVWRVCTAGADQVAIQRYAATADAKAARRSYLVNALAGFVVLLLLAAAGFALLGFFQATPHLVPDGMTLIGNADYLFPHYIANFLPVGVSGLVVAAMFAAAMSSLDSGINSVTTVLMTDFLDRFRRGQPSEEQHVRTAKYFVLFIGLVVVLISSQMGRIPGNFLEVTKKTCNLFVAPLFGLFFMALFVPFATPFGTACGATYGLVTAVLVGFWDVITGRPALSFQWINVWSLAANLVVGVALSLVPTRGKSWKFLCGVGALAAAPLVVVVWLAAG